jgi:hypothetical protein
MAKRWKMAPKFKLSRYFFIAERFREIILSRSDLQAEWDDIVVTSYTDSGCMCAIRRGQTKHPHWRLEESERTVVIDFVLLRSVTRSIKGQDSKHKLFTFIHANLPSINSLMSGTDKCSFARLIVSFIIVIVSFYFCPPSSHR